MALFCKLFMERPTLVEPPLVDGRTKFH